MRMILMFLLLASSNYVLAQSDMEDDSEDVIQEETVFPEENYEAEMFIQKQEEFTYPPLSSTEGIEETMSDAEVFDSDSDY